MIMRPFGGPAPGARRPNPRAHGNVCYLQTRKCSKTGRRFVRVINVNGVHREVGAWREEA
jgi:hypothetical protein